MSILPHLPTNYPIPLRDQASSEAENLLDLSRGKHSPDPLRMELGERRIDQVTTLHPPPLQQERPERLEKTDLEGRVRRMRSDEFLELPGHIGGPPLERLHAQHVPDELHETRGPDIVDL